MELEGQRDVRTAALTPSEVRGVVVDVGQLHGDCRGARQPAQVPSHVFGLENHQVFVSALSVHVRYRGAEDAWWEEHRVAAADFTVTTCLLVSASTCARSIHLAQNMLLNV